HGILQLLRRVQCHKHRQQARVQYRITIPTTSHSLPRISIHKWPFSPGSCGRKWPRHRHNRATLFKNSTSCWSTLNSTSLSTCRTCCATRNTKPTRRFVIRIHPLPTTRWPLQTSRSAQRWSCYFLHSSCGSRTSSRCCRALSTVWARTYEHAQQRSRGGLKTLLQTCSRG